MVLTPSTMLPLGTQAPVFSLRDVVSGTRLSLDSFSGKQGLLIMFICTHCPYVKHVQNELARLGRDYQGKDIGMVAISANDPVTHPEDSPAELKSMAQRLNFTFPYCFDEDQSVAKAYTAACTPDFFLFDRNRRLVYRGQLDDSRPGNDHPNDGRDLRAAIDAVLSGKPVSPNQKPSIGCNIKWKPGDEPSYAR
ncbi:MAG: thioredoxin family protein [Acidobacteriota bacterium]